MFVSMHSYGQFITYPSQVNSSYQSNKIDDTRDMAIVASKSLRYKESTSRYLVDSLDEMLAPRSGK